MYTHDKQSCKVLTFEQSELERPTIILIDQQNLFSDLYLVKFLDTSIILYGRSLNGSLNHSNTLSYNVLTKLAFYKIIYTTITDINNGDRISDLEYITLPTT